MSVIIKDVEKGSPAACSKIKSGDILLKIDNNEIMDVLDYRFYQTKENLTLTVADESGKIKEHKIKKGEYDEIGLLFDTYLMDKKRTCANKCIFCFIDQLPKNLRKSLYFKDDDSRLSFLFGNYITLTNITEHEIDRIIKMHISPVNISVHTTNPALRVKMMNNKNAGEALKVLYRLNDAGISLNSQLVLCPDYNDGDELVKTLEDLTNLDNMQCIAAVPVGLTKYRDSLTDIKPFDKQSAEKVIDTIDKFGDLCLKKYGTRRVYASDEFYLIAKREIPSAEFYGDFLQLENGVGLWALLKSEALDALTDVEITNSNKRKISIATGVSAFPLIKEIAELCEKKCGFLSVNVYAVRNDFFGEKITVSGLVCATDILNQLKNCDLGDEILIPSSMLRSERDMFLDSITVTELSKKLGVKVTVTEVDGYELVDTIINGVK